MYNSLTPILFLIGVILGFWFLVVSFKRNLTNIEENTVPKKMLLLVSVVLVGIIWGFAWLVGALITEEITPWDIFYFVLVLTGVILGFRFLMLLLISNLPKAEGKTIHKKMLLFVSVLVGIILLFLWAMLSPSCRLVTKTEREQVEQLNRARYEHEKAKAMQESKETSEATNKNRQRETE